MSKRLAFVTMLAMPLGFFGCGADSRPTTADDGRGHGTSYACGTKADPVTFVLRDVAPAAGTTVANQSIVQRFTLVDPPFVFTSGLTFNFLATHTAGTPSPLTLQFTVDMSAKDHVYSTTVDAWSTAPGHVEMGEQATHFNGNGCAFVFPSPLFSYDVTSP
jgi:hypothetical protein